jgi:hypothetical protein
MATRERRRVWVKTLSVEEKRTIAARCDRFVADLLKPRFLPTILLTEFNYPVDIYGKWRGNRYSFITRYRSGFPDNAGEEFDSAFARLDHVEEAIAELRFDVMWHRHNGRWWRLHSSVPLERALSLIESDQLLWPI